MVHIASQDYIFPANRRIKTARWQLEFAVKTVLQVRFLDNLITALGSISGDMVLDLGYI